MAAPQPNTGQPTMLDAQSPIDDVVAGLMEAIHRRGRGGNLAAAQDLARHSTPTLTKKYTDLSLADYQRGLEGLPPVANSQSADVQRQQQQKGSKKGRKSA